MYTLKEGWINWSEKILYICNYKKDYIIYGKFYTLYLVNIEHYIGVLIYDVNM